MGRWGPIFKRLCTCEEIYQYISTVACWEGVFLVLLSWGIVGTF